MLPLGLCNSWLCGQLMGPGPDPGPAVTLWTCVHLRLRIRKVGVGSGSQKAQGLLGGGWQVWTHRQALLPPLPDAASLRPLSPLTGPTAPAVVSAQEDAI